MGEVETVEPFIVPLNILKGTVGHPLMPQLPHVSSAPAVI